MLITRSNEQRMLGNKTPQHLRIIVISCTSVAIEMMAFMYDSFHLSIKLH